VVDEDHHQRKTAHEVDPVIPRGEVGFAHGFSIADGCNDATPARIERAAQPAEIVCDKGGRKAGRSCG
jgi:hypothetical protein